MQVRANTPEELKAAAAVFLASLTKREGAAVVTLSGDLGAGKTTFVQGLATALGVNETVTSPTFVIEKVYALTDQKWQRLVHIDAYRLNSSRELTVLGWQDCIADAGNLVVLEWPEKVADLMPPHARALRFDIEGDTRIITIYGEESRS